jgi:transposase InsO family protein
MIRGSQDRLALHRSGQPQQNAFIESFIGRLRDEMLGGTLFRSLAHCPCRIFKGAPDKPLFQAYSI